MKLSDLQPVPGSRKQDRRVGRGHGSGRVKTSGRGTKGQKARTGGQIPAHFEGGQLSLAKRLSYRRGFTNIFKKEYAIINLQQLDRFGSEEEVNAETLVAYGLLKPSEAAGLIKVLGIGEISKNLTVRAHKFSASAKSKIEAAGGKVIVLEEKKVTESAE